MAGQLGMSGQGHGRKLDRRGGDHGQARRDPGTAQRPHFARTPGGRARFRASASPLAYRLVGYLSVVQLTLPIMRLVQRVMLPSSGPTDLAEVFVSGLLHRSGAGQTDPERVLYDFAAGVREVLVETIRASEAVQVTEEVSVYVAEHFGQSRDTGALLAGQGDQALASGSLPFAVIPGADTARAGRPLRRQPVRRCTRVRCRAKRAGPELEERLRRDHRHPLERQQFSAASTPAQSK